MKLSEIYLGYKNLLFKDEEVEEYALKRLEICNSCTDRSNYPDSINILSTCNICHCVLRSKARSPKAFCPIKKWNSEE